MIDPQHPNLSVSCQCQLVGVPRSSFYFKPQPVKPEDLELMRMIDEQYLKTPFYGSRSMTKHFRRLGHKINRKRVQRLMRLMGIEAVYPKPRTSKPHPDHKTYPYLLRNLTIDRPNQVWAADITYIPLKRGFMYLVAVMDWYSRYVLAWELSSTMETWFCVAALERALGLGQPGIQHRSGVAVHERGVHGMSGRSGDTDQHGWPGPGVGQCVHRAVVAQCEVRGHLPPGLPGWTSGTKGTGTILSVLQHRAAPSGFTGQDSGGGPLRVRSAGHRRDQGDQ